MNNLILLSRGSLTMTDILFRSEVKRKLSSNSNFLSLPRILIKVSFWVAFMNSYYISLAASTRATSSGEGPMYIFAPCLLVSGTTSWAKPSKMKYYSASSLIFLNTILSLPYRSMTTISMLICRSSAPVVSNFLKLSSLNPLYRGFPSS